MTKAQIYIYFFIKQQKVHVNCTHVNEAFKEPTRSNEPILSNESRFSRLVSAHFTPTSRSTDRCQHETLHDWTERTTRSVNSQSDASAQSMLGLVVRRRFILFSSRYCLSSCQQSCKQSEDTT